MKVRFGIAIIMVLLLMGCIEFDWFKLVCDTEKDCEKDQYCHNGFCVAEPPVEPECQSDSDCPNGQKCHRLDNDSNVCAYIESWECATNNDCNSEEICDSGFCVAKPPVELECQSDSDCGEGEICLQDICVIESVPPVVCATEADCQSGQACRWNPETARRECQD